MSIALAIFALIIVLLSLLGVFQPTKLTSVVRTLMVERSGLWVASGVRLVLAVLLWFSASLSLTPITFKVLAVVMLLASLALPMVGSQRLLKWVEWVSSWSPSVIRLWCLVGVAFGAFLLWSISPAFTAA